MKNLFRSDPVFNFFVFFHILYIYYIETYYSIMESSQDIRAADFSG